MDEEEKKKQQLSSAAAIFGRAGGRAMVKKYGREHMREIGLKGVAARKRLIK